MQLGFGLPCRYLVRRDEEMKVFCMSRDQPARIKPRDSWRAWMWRNVEVLQWARTVRKQPENFDEGSRVYHTSG
jgi:hypothetical protein